jgi:hypothetical protein
MSFTFSVGVGDGIEAEEKKGPDIRVQLSILQGWSGVSFRQVECQDPMMLVPGHHFLLERNADGCRRTRRTNEGKKKIGGGNAQLKSGGPKKKRNNGFEVS